MSRAGHACSRSSRLRPRVAVAGTVGDHAASRRAARRRPRRRGDEAAGKGCRRSRSTSASAAIREARRAHARGERSTPQGQAQPAARAIFARYHSLAGPDRRGVRALAGRTASTTLKRLVAAHPQSAAAQLHLGWALLLVRARRRRRGAAGSASRRVRRLAGGGRRRRTSSIPNVRAGPAAAHPRASALPSAPTAAGAAAHARAATRAAPTSRRSCATASRSGRSGAGSRRSAQFEAAAALAPHDPVAQTAAAVALFTKRRSGAGVLAARPADGGLPAGRRRPLPPRHAPALDAAASRRAPKQLRLAVADAARLALREGGPAAPSSPSRSMGPSKENMSRTAYGAPSAAAGIAAPSIVVTSRQEGST